MYIIPYIIPMLLGRTFDYNRATVGVDIFSGSTINKHTQTINRYTTESRFRLIRSAQDVDNLLDIKGELSLKVMANLVNVEGMGSYLKNKEDRTNMVEVLCRVQYETVTETLETYATPLDGWLKTNALILGTHYVRSITYGGELVASIKFKSNSRRAAENIDAKITAGLGIEGTLDLDIGAKFKKFQENSTSSLNTDIKYYATVPVRGVPQTLEGLQGLIGNFSKHVKEVNNGKGNPIRVELYPLSALTTGSNVVNFVRNAAVSSKLQEVVEKYDDVLTASRELNSWVNGLHFLNKDIQRKIGLFNNILTNVSHQFYFTISNIKIDQNAKVDQFAAALDVYRGEDSFVLPGKYLRLFRILKTEVSQELTGVGACVFGPPIVNTLIPRDNQLKTSKTKDATLSLNTKNVASCKAKCVAEAKCTSITYLLAKGSDGVKDGPKDKCFLNWFPLWNTRLLPLSRDPNDPSTLVFVRNKSGRC